MNFNSKKIDVKIRTEYINQEPLPKFYRGFNIDFENISIRIVNNSLIDVMDAIKTALDKDKSVQIMGFSIKRLSTKDIEKMKNQNIYINGCRICNIKSPIFEICGINDHTKLYLCKRHLRKLYNYLNDINEFCYITIKPYEDFEIKN